MGAWRRQLRVQRSVIPEFDLAGRVCGEHAFQCVCGRSLLSSTYSKVCGREGSPLDHIKRALRTREVVVVVVESHNDMSIRNPACYFNILVFVQLVEFVKELDSLAEIEPKDFHRYLPVFLCDSQPCDPADKLVTASQSGCHVRARADGSSSQPPVRIGDVHIRDDS
jgi:hypothetical protein